MKKKIIIRDAVLSDSLRLSILYQHVYIDTYGTEGISSEFANFMSSQFAIGRIENIIRQNPGNIIVAQYNDNLVGVAEIELNKKCPIDNIVATELSKLYILERFCGMGIGQKLLKAAEETVYKRGEKQIWLWVYLLNARAIAFYEKQQYKWIGNAFFQMELNKYENKVLLKKL